MKMSHDATFVVPLPKTLQAFATPNTLGAPKNAKLAATSATTLTIFSSFDERNSVIGTTTTLQAAFRLAPHPSS